MAEQRRIPGYIKLNSQPYLVSRDPKTLEAKYAIDNTPKTQVVSRRMDTSTGKSNIVEGLFKGLDGFGAGKLKNARSTYTYSSDHYHYATNIFTEREGEWIVLPSPRSIIPDAGTVPNPLVNYTFDAPVIAWEQYHTFFTPAPLETFFLADHRAFSIRVETGMDISLDEDFFFEGQATPTGGVVFNNIFFAAMGGGQRTTDRYIRKRDPLTGIWTNDDNNPKAVIGIAGGGVVNVTAHGYVNGEVVFLSNMTTAAYNGLWTITAVGDANHFTLGSLPFTVSATGLANMQDSDVQAQDLVMVGDLMYRSYYDSVQGWLVSAVDAVSSNPMLSANWTAGNGTLGAGDAFEAVTGLIATPNGVLITKSDGVFIYSKRLLTYINVTPELNHNRHPSNGIGAYLWENWVYIPTVIGLLRWKDGIVQDVTPGRGLIQDFETPGLPIAWICGDSNRLYAITKPYQLNAPLNVKNIVSKFGIDKTGTGVVDFGQTLNEFDGDHQTFIDLLGFNLNGFMYLGYTQPWHRAHFDIGTGMAQAAGAGSTELAAQVWTGAAWVNEDIVFDGTMGWLSTDADPTTFSHGGDVVVGMINPDWATGGTATGGGGSVLDNTMYWRRYRFKGAAVPAVSFGVHEIDIGIHSPNALIPLMTGELQNDHGGVVYVLSMTDEQGAGPLWRTLWAFTQPDHLYQDSGSDLGFGGPSKVGWCGIVQPEFLRAKTEGDRHLFIGMQSISYLCPLGNRPDITNVPYLQWDAWPAADGPASAFDVGPRMHAIILPDADFGLPQHQKTLTEIEFDPYEGFDLSSCEVYYRVDRGAWVFAGFADDQSPDMPIVMSPGGEPTGKEFAIAIVFDGTAQTPLHLPRIRDIRARVQPRPEMSEMLQLTVELEPETVEPNFTDRRSAHSRYVDLRSLQTTGSSVSLVGLDGATVYAQVLQVSQKSILNKDAVPRLVADVFLSLTTPRTDDP